MVRWAKTGFFHESQRGNDTLSSFNITSFSIKFKLIKGTMFLWSGSGLMVAGVVVRILCGRRKKSEAVRRFSEDDGYDPERRDERNACAIERGRG